MNYSIDASAAIAYLEGEPGAEVVEPILLDPDNGCEIHIINLIEVYYHFLRAFDQLTAEQAVQDLIAAGVAVNRDVGDEFCRRVGQLKAIHRISLADCFCVALATESSA